MTKLNVNICSNCNTENPLFLKNCANCKHYIRTVVVNIDLWHTIYQLFENPKKALKKIIYAEHKNFILFLLFFVSSKLFLLSMAIQSALKINSGESDFISYNFLLLTAIYASLILFSTKLLTVIINKRSKTRYKDNLSLFLYSSIPMIISLFILTPVEYGIFGEHWFIYNPPPFIIKTNLAYLLAGLEILMIFWSVTILYKAFRIQTNSKPMSFFLIIPLILGFLAAVIFIPYIIV